ncbi:MAG: SoxR reducing system RseC family protein [Clostridia bacterium]|nr:SoxR reducing system RseC family protein [Clostridia bacterium]
MTETGTVSKIDSRNRATVQFPRKTACEHCHMCLKPKNEMFVRIAIKNTLDAKVGDTVSVSMGTQVVLAASFIVYMVPVLLVAAALFATRGLGELASFGIAMGVLVISYIIIAFIDKWLKKNKDYTPKMVEIIKQEE